MKIYVLGYKGMLGRYVYTYLKMRKYDVVGFSRNELDVSPFNQMQLHAALFHLGLKKDDVVINCIGTIKSVVSKKGTAETIKVNALFPHYLAQISEKEGYKMIHITTDCVFSGNDGNYNENASHDCIDVYGKTKSLGEPENCTVIRTSIIGEEETTNRSLIEWIRSMKDKTADGYTNHKWNGLTCLQTAKIFEDIIINNKYWKGVRHIFSPEVVTKCELVQMVSDIYGLNIKVNPIETTIKCDRSLSTIYNDITFSIPPLKEQIEEQFNYLHKEK